jgi:hypothetical protein
MKRYFSLFILVLAFWGAFAFDAFALSIAPGKLIITDTNTKEYSFTIIRDDYREKEVLEIDVSDPSGLLNLDQKQQLVLGRGQEKYEFQFEVSDQFDTKKAQTAIINLTPEVKEDASEEGVVNIVSAVGFKVEYDPTYKPAEFLRLDSLVQVSGERTENGLAYTIANKSAKPLELEGRFQVRNDGVFIHEEVKTIVVASGKSQTVDFERAGNLPGDYVGVFSVTPAQQEGSSVSAKVEYIVQPANMHMLKMLLYAMVLILASVLLVILGLLFGRITRKQFLVGLLVHMALLVVIIGAYAYQRIQVSGSLVAMEYNSEYMKMPTPGYLEVYSDAGHRFINLASGQETLFDGKWTTHIASNDRYIILNDRNEGYVLRQKERQAIRIPVQGAVKRVRAAARGYVVQNTQDELFYFDRQFITEPVPVRVLGELVAYDGAGDTFTITGTEGTLKYNPVNGEYQNVESASVVLEDSSEFKQVGRLFYGELNSREGGVRLLPKGVTVLESLGAQYYLAMYQDDLFIVDFRTNRMMYVMTKKDSEQYHYLAEGSVKTPKM